MPTRLFTNTTLLVMTYQSVNKVGNVTVGPSGIGQGGIGQGGIRRRRKAARPTEILQAALEEFSLKGFSAARLDDVAARAGITKGTIYVYFPSKEDLFVAMLKQKSQATTDNLKALTDDPKASAIDILKRHLAFVAEMMVVDPCGRNILRILLAEGERFPSVVDRWFAEVMEPALDALRAVLRRGVEQGEFRASAVADYPQLIMAPFIVCNSWLALAGSQRPIDIRRFFEEAVDLLANGLLRR